ncbi:hypothetical protein TK1930 [Thermococcus kodakarensis KOD1]|uniref:Uncharacterized protein n=1 Tax=Thermococcus kodakarensis (strain ATCC BAA-918 / JCM 12380 / KOD1) TaxID=69014 RepID=Q5JET5_THEKO|nr:hypothetical protein [Thermococcus kodakarensis]WCN29412.1 hypothetical protein POG15_09825 [Thermococcus kodakarensis]WCN31695.1 hypothetical protein POG21_09810 [Thermococcus kodakarensis]BAD86119.1 hypothetical protein TK1930 [Thermococcus kodakarensis KOD1]
MGSELIRILKEKHSFLSVMLESIERAISNIEEGKNPEEVYYALTTFLGEFPTKAMLQKLADEKGLGIKVKDKESAIEVIKRLSG